MVVKPGHPFQRGQFQRFLGLLRRPVANQLSLFQAVNYFGEDVVIAVTPTFYQQLDARLDQSLAVPDRHTLRPPVGTVRQRIAALRLPAISETI